MTDEQQTTTGVTFSEAGAQELIDALGVTTCAACGEAITAETFGGALAVEGKVVAFHSTLSCFLAFIDRQQGMKRMQ